MEAGAKVGTPCQVLSLGAGYDTTYFQLKSEVRAYEYVSLKGCYHRCIWIFPLLAVTVGTV